MKRAVLLFPHQLFRNTTHLPHDAPVFLVEESLFFTQYAFHAQKLIFHRATMQAYRHYLEQAGYRVHYIPSTVAEHDVRRLLVRLKNEGFDTIAYPDVCDDWLDRRICTTAAALELQPELLEGSIFLADPHELENYFGEKSSYFQTDFYIFQRKKYGLLLDEKGKPLQGKWSFDAENRQRYPANVQPPPLLFPPLNPYIRDARASVQQQFAGAPGKLHSAFIYPTTFAEADAWLDQFLAERFHHFGAYEDAIVRHASVLHHSVLTPLLNTGLLEPETVVRKALDYATAHGIPYNSLEGFIRQLIGWREFIRAIYLREGRRQRTRNFWNFRHGMPAAFYTASTAILPVDATIRKVLQTGYAHHIERLMILSNFMLLCEIHPDAVYQWFMELFIDAYDWVMVPNVYGMGQFADGGLMCTKPYISGSNYVLKMSDYPKDGSWTGIWDALFWRFMHKHRDFFAANPRLGMLIRNLDRMPAEKKQQHLRTAEQYLEKLHQS